jgi:hypothetical protein
VVRARSVEARSADLRQSTTTLTHQRPPAGHLIGAGPRFRWPGPHLQQAHENNTRAGQSSGG